MKKFKVKLDHSGAPGTWSTVTLPCNVEKTFGSKARAAKSVAMITESRRLKS